MSDTKDANLSALTSEAGNNPNAILAGESVVRGIGLHITSCIRASLQLGATVEELAPFSLLAQTLQEGAVEIATSIVANTDAAHAANEDPATTHSEATDGTE